MFVGCECTAFNEDVASKIRVPVKFSPHKLEYRSGYDAGYKGLKTWNPVPHRSKKAADRRLAWEAGKAAGRRARLDEAKGRLS